MRINSADNFAEISAMLDQFPNVSVLVVGDIMLDAFWSGTVSRLSPEAPVPVLELKRTVDVPGGAANVAANITGLNADVYLVGIIGTDEAGERLRCALGNRDVSSEFLTRSDSRRTTTKTRIIAHSQQIVRVDDETNEPLSEYDETRLIARAIEMVSVSDVVVLSDYAKGCLTSRVASEVSSTARDQGKLVLVDPKSKDFRKYDGATLLTPNLSEALAAANLDGPHTESIEHAASKLLAETKIDSLLVTLSENGMKLFSREHESVHFRSTARQVFDVTGAGDTVIATLAVGLGTGARMTTAISVANIAAGLAVEKVGTAVVPLDELRSAVDDEKLWSAEVG